MHYSEKLKNQVSEERARIRLAEDRIRIFRKHLCSSKFHVDTTIQVSDVHRWLDLIDEDLTAIFEEK